MNTPHPAKQHDPVTAGGALHDMRWLVERLDHTGAEHRRGILVVKAVELARIEDLFGYFGRETVLDRVGFRLRDLVGAMPLGRLHRDEYFILVETDSPDHDVAVLAQQVTDAMALPLEMDGTLVRVEIRIGVVFAPDHGNNSDTLLSRAITALNQASRSNAAVAYFDDGMHRAAREWAEIYADLREAQAKDQFELYYQPKAALRDHSLVGFEALIRWNRPNYGVVPPNKFIPLAEEAGLIRDIDIWVATEASAAITRINNRFGTNLAVSINASSSELDVDTYVGCLRALVGDRAVQPRWLEIEMTESIIASDMDAAASLLAEIRALGIRVSIDDFGMGYSSLHRLRTFPATGLKIDQSFVRDLFDSKVARLIVRSTIELGHALGLEIIAEGVETEAQVSQLTAMGADLYQGYFLSRPMPESALMNWLAKRVPYRPVLDI